jgi:prepilin-type processing-associated H-X9-DG protein
MAANFIYAEACDGKFVPINSYQLTSGGRGGAATYTRWVENQLFKRIMARGKRHNAETDISVQSDFLMPKEYLCPSDEVSKNIFNAVTASGTWSGSYGYNGTEFAMEYGDITNRLSWVNRPTAIGHTSQSIKRASEKLAFTDSVDWWVAWGGADYRTGWDVLHQASLQTYKDNDPRVDGPTIYRHSEGADVAFYDGHVSYMKKQDIFVIKDYDTHPRKAGMWVADKGLWCIGHTNDCY